MMSDRIEEIKEFYFSNRHEYNKVLQAVLVDIPFLLDEIERLTSENAGLREYSESRDESIKVYREEIKELKGIEAVYEFANKLAKTMLELSSSHVFFLMQQAFGDETEWSDVEDMLNNIITLTEIR